MASASSERTGSSLSGGKLDPCKVEWTENGGPWTGRGVVRSIPTNEGDRFREQSHGALVGPATPRAHVLAGRRAHSLRPTRGHLTLTTKGGTGRQARRPVPESHRFVKLKNVPPILPGEQEPLGPHVGPLQPFQPVPFQ